MKATGSKLIRVLNTRDGYVEYDVDRQLYYLQELDRTVELTQKEFELLKSSTARNQDVPNKSYLR